MSTIRSTVPGKTQVRQDVEWGHRLRVRLAACASAAFVGSLLIYGANYYRLPMEERPFSEKHALLRPSGTIGLQLGILGTALFIVIFLYALRKVIPWLGRIGTAKHWMDFHVICGVTAPFVIALHASFKFRGIAGVAFWIMLAVALSGVIGRYLYSQIPRSMTAAELSLNELEMQEQVLAENLRGQSIYSARRLEGIMRMPSPETIRKTSPALAIAQMFILDIRRPFQIAGLRRSAATFSANLRSAAGLFSSGNPEVEQVVAAVRQKAALSKRILFLDHTHRVFNLWHVIHRPFSYAFAALALLHIAVVVGLGFL